VGVRVNKVFLNVFAASVSLLFHLARKSKWDRLIGNLSCPVCLVHPLIFSVFLTRLGAQPALYGSFGGLYQFGPAWCLAALAAYSCRRVVCILASKRRSTAFAHVSESESLIVIGFAWDPRQQLRNRIGSIGSTIVVFDRQACVPHWARTMGCSWRPNGLEMTNFSRVNASRSA
jgi:hypothetical protein